MRVASQTTSGVDGDLGDGVGGAVALRTGPAAEHPGESLVGPAATALGLQPGQVVGRGPYDLLSGRNRSRMEEVVFVVFLTHHRGVDMTDLIPTGEAARLLGCSRQHVVDLCNKGKLPVVRKGGSHRYVRRSDVLALTDRSPTRDQEQSRWLHLAIVGHLVQEPDLVLTRARENLDRFSKVHEGTMAEYWLDLWRKTIDSGPDRVVNALVSDTSEARELRQNSPFTGILSSEERRTVLNSFRKQWSGSTLYDA